LFGESVFKVVFFGFDFLVMTFTLERYKHEFVGTAGDFNAAEVPCLPIAVNYVRTLPVHAVELVYIAAHRTLFL